MRTIVTVLLVLALSSRQADGSWKWDWLLPNSNQPMPGMTADGAEEQAIVNIEQDWAAAMVKADVTAMEPFLGREWVYSLDGQVTNRAQMLAEVKSGAYKVDSAVLRDLQARVFGDVAIATMTGDMKGSYRGKDISGSARSTDFFVKRDDRWQCVSTQNMTIE